MFNFTIMLGISSSKVSVPFKFYQKVFYFVHLLTRVIYYSEMVGNICYIVILTTTDTVQWIR